MSDYVIDTTLLSNFARVKRPDWLRQALSGQLYSPSRVLEELHTGERLGYVPVYSWDWLHIVTLTPEERLAATALMQHLDAGEAECIAVAQARQMTLLTDDRVARRAARHLGISVSGTLGVLSRLVKRNIVELEEADRALAEIPRLGYRSPVRSLRELPLFQGGHPRE